MIIIKFIKGRTCLIRCAIKTLIVDTRTPGMQMINVLLINSFVDGDSSEISYHRPFFTKWITIM
ncbi:MAG: hypothetical protein ACTSRC_03195, partial [Candidatus Helarchaeota archaeon]